jgi:hypothetical protein
MQTSSQLRHPAPHSRLKEKDWEVKTLETVSPQFYELSEEVNPNFSVSKTCLDCYQPLLIPETNPAHISNRCSKSFTQVGTMRNGLLSEHNSLGLSGEVRGSYSLPRPGALSKSSPACRPPGNTKSEAQAKKLGIIQKNEVFNPEWLEQQFGLPIGWTSPQELGAATELIAPVVPPLEISLTPELPKLHSSESCTSIPLVATAKESQAKYSAATASLKAISLWQPWASLIPLGLKHYETRSWKTNYRGKLLICSTANNPKHYREYLKIKDELQLPPWGEANFPHGQAIAICDLVDCIEMTPEFIEQQSETEILCGDWQVGRYAWKLENIQSITELFAVKGKQGLFTVSLDIFQPQQKLTELLGNNQVNPSNDRDRDRDIENSPSNDISPSKDSPSKKRQKGEGNGYIHWRTITKNGKDYPQAYYHWKENGNKRTNYIPKQLLGLVEEAEKQKRPVIEILELLGVGISPSNLLGDEKVNTAESIDITRFLDSPSKSPSNEISPSKRRKGDGSGTIHWRTITRGGKDYPQAYYHYEFWSGGDRIVKSSRYIPKRLLAQVQQLDVEKAPVREILQVLGVMV